VRLRHGCALAIAAAVTVPLAACGSPENPAERAARTLVAALASVHPTEVCDNGDAGVGIDNDIPWSIVYLVVDLVPDLDQRMVDAAAKVGWHLEPDSTRARRAVEAAASYAAGTPRRGPDATVLEPVPAVPSTSFLAATANGRMLKVAVARTGEMSTRCRMREQSGATPVKPGSAAVIIDVELPAR
jgi:hypothetical protein